MKRFCGIKNNLIQIISTKPFINSDVKILEVPASLDLVSDTELICDFEIRAGEFINRKTPKEASKLRVALVGNWKMQCGIYKYAENLWPEVVKLVGEIKIFSEHNENPTSDMKLFGNQILRDSQVVQRWKRGENCSELVRELKEWNPDIIWIQHEYGLWPNASHWIALMSQLSRFRVIVTMHSTFYHRDKTICEAVIPEIVVHLSGAKRVLEQEKQIPGKVHLIPHGCYPCTSQEKLWNLYKSEHTLLQFGFGFRYKGWEKALRTVAILKETYSDIFFTGLFSESHNGRYEHQIYYQELMELSERLGILNNVGIIRGFQSDSSLDSFLRTSQVALFPYVSNPQHEVWGASGAARMAMAKAIPVITSSVNHFSDVPSIKADSPEDIAREVSKLFESHELKKSQIEKQLHFISENNWENVAAKYVKLFSR